MQYLELVKKLFVWTLGIALFAIAMLLLLTILPLENGYSARIVENGSMEPTVPLGSTIFTKLAEEYVAGDVVTFQRRSDDQATTHRIVDIEIDEDGEAVFITKGDANDAADMQPVEEEEIAGKVIFQIEYLGYILDFAKQPLGFFILVGLPASWIVYEQWQIIRREWKKDTEA